jgi:hypothetical protein
MDNAPAIVRRFPVKTARDRLLSTGIHIQIWGPPKLGKTTQIFTLDDLPGVLVANRESGLLSVVDQPFLSIDIHSWVDAKNLACYLVGPDESRNHDYSQAHYEHCCNNLWGDPAQLNGYHTYFIDSTSFISSDCFEWCKTQPRSFSEKTGKPDTRGTFGLLAEEMVSWAKQLHRSPKNVILVGGLSEYDDNGRKKYVPMIDGAKAGNMFPYIFDEIITLTDVMCNDGQTRRAFVCTPNPWGFPAGDRSTKLSMIEEPHLGRLLRKIKDRPVRAAEDYTYETAIPQLPTAAQEEVSIGVVETQNTETANNPAEVPNWT